MDSPRRSRTVLVVEDDLFLLATCKQALERAGHIALAASNSANARTLAALHKPEVCLIDMQLGTESGLDLIRELAELLPDARIVLASGYNCIDTTVTAMRAGATDVVSKPFTVPEVLQRLENRAERVPAAHERTPLTNETASMDRTVWEHARRALADCNGNRSEAARRLGIDRGTLQRWLDRPPPRR